MKLFDWLNENEDDEPPSSPRLLAKLQSLSDVPVKRVMVPRALIVALDADVDPRRVRRLKTLNATYLAVYRGDLDHILGWIPKAEVLAMIQDPNAEVNLAAHARSAGFIDEDAPTTVLGDAFLKYACPFLIARNREGQTTGLVSLAEYVELVFGLSLGQATPVPGPTPVPLRDFEL